MIKHQYVVQYGFAQRDAEIHWEDDGTWQFGFDPEDGKGQELARQAVTAVALWCAHEDNEGETDEDLWLPHRVIHRISSDEPL